MHTDDVISLNGSSRPIPRVIERESWAAIHRLTEMRALGAKIGVANDGKEVQVQRGSHSPYLSHTHGSPFVSAAGGL